MYSSFVGDSDNASDSGPPPPGYNPPVEIVSTQLTAIAVNSSPNQSDATTPNPYDFPAMRTSLTEIFPKEDWTGTSLNIFFGLKKWRRLWWYFHYWANEDQSLTDFLYCLSFTHNVQPTHTIKVWLSSPRRFIIQDSTLYFPFHLIKCFHVKSNYTVREDGTKIIPLTSWQCWKFALSNKEAKGRVIFVRMGGCSLAYNIRRKLHYGSRRKIQHRA